MVRRCVVLYLVRGGCHKSTKHHLITMLTSCQQTAASAKRDLILTAILACLATGSTIAVCMYSYGSGVKTGVKAAAYFWIVSAILGWIRVTIILIEDQYDIAVMETYSWLWRRPTKAQKMGEEKHNVD